MIDVGRSSRAADGRMEEVADGHWRLSGPLSLETVPGYWRRARALLRPDTGLTLDLSGVERADSSGLALLVSLLREARASQTALQFANIPAQLHSLARVSGVEGLLPVVEDGVGSAPVGHGSASKSLDDSHDGQ